MKSFVTNLYIRTLTIQMIPALVAPILAFGLLDELSLKLKLYDLNSVEPASESVSLLSGYKENPLN